MKRFNVYFCYAGVKHLLYSIEATNVNVSAFKENVLVGKVDHEGVFWPNDNLISKINILYSSQDRHSVEFGVRKVENVTTKQSIFARIWAEEKS